MLAAPAAPAAEQKPVAAPGTELTFLEYPQTPASKFKPTQPLESTVMSVKRAIGPDAPGEICHVALQTGGRLPYVEGQSIGVLPPGIDAKTGKPHQQRLYSIASAASNFREVPPLERDGGGCNALASPASATRRRIIAESVLMCRATAYKQQISRRTLAVF